MAKSIAVIPVRGGSKGVWRKNHQLVGGMTLLERSARSCLASRSFDEIVVSSDDSALLGIAESLGLRAVERPHHLSGDSSSSESAVLHALQTLEVTELDFRLVALIQATSPFLRPQFLTKAVGLVDDGSYDTVFSGVNKHPFLWHETEQGFRPVNHSSESRQTRQQVGPIFAESGAFYVTNLRLFLGSGSRFNGKVGCVEVPAFESLEIDSQEDLALANLTLKVLTPQVSLQNVKALVTDFDGVHTDDRATIDSNGVETVSFSRADGLGIELLKRFGVHVLIISREANDVVKQRAKKLGVPVLADCRDKAEALKNWTQEMQIDLSQVAYLGNDVNDIECLQLAGVGIAPFDSHPSVLKVCDFVTLAKGGKGAVREACEMVIAGFDNQKGT